MKTLVYSTAIAALIGVGSASAQTFEPTNMNDDPTPYTQEMDTTVGNTQTMGARVGFSAASGFGPSDQNDQPTPRIFAHQNDGYAATSGMTTASVSAQPSVAERNFEPTNMNDEQTPY
ncbi:hypothetical protein [Nitratireductor basaltis]|uniref:Uncharacterized protein n=1 Tax=Nitratireductor basaltis TaxID=472175 RepID=A0A084UEA2_9HYPH|nr:hypothetical protein [Nitratireductor basaltis]KFB11288.1 hypothetical protein EL18_02336 [Nitratireductor basaltis]